MNFGHGLCSAFAYLFPYIPNPLLRLAWNELHQIGSVPIPWVEPEKTAPYKAVEILDNVQETTQRSKFKRHEPQSNTNEVNFNELFGINDPKQSLFDQYFGTDVLGDLDNMEPKQSILPSSEWDPSFFPGLDSQDDSDFGGQNITDELISTPKEDKLPIKADVFEEQISQFFNLDDSGANSQFDSCTPTKSPETKLPTNTHWNISHRRKKKANPKQVVLNRNHTPIKKRKSRILNGIPDLYTGRSDVDSNFSDSPMSSQYRFDSETPLSYQDEPTPFSIPDSDADMSSFAAKRKKSTPKKLEPKVGITRVSYTPIHKPVRTKRDRTDSPNNTTPKRRKRIPSEASPKILPSVQFASMYELGSTDDDDKDYSIKRDNLEPQQIMEGNQMLPMGKNGQGKLRNSKNRYAVDRIQNKSERIGLNSLRNNNPRLPFSQRVSIH